MKEDLKKGISSREPTSNSEQLRGNTKTERAKQRKKTVKDKRGSFTDLC